MMIEMIEQSGIHHQEKVSLEDQVINNELRKMLKK